MSRLHPGGTVSLVLVAALSTLGGPARAAGELALEKIADRVYAIVGDLGNRSPENLGNNATFGFVDTVDGVVLIDPGGSYKGAQRIEQVIRTVTAKPIITVINTGGQDHRWLGNSYFKDKGARIIASASAVEDQTARTRDQLFRLEGLVGADGLEGTTPLPADTTFESELEIVHGDTTFVIVHAGHAHTPGDSFVWLPEQRVVFTGDIVYVERMLGVGSQSNSASWVEVFDAMAAYRPARLVPGHGKVTTLAHATRDTRDYLTFLREAVAGFMDDGGDIADIGEVDQSRFEYLANFELLAGRNAQQVFSELEWE